MLETLSDIKIKSVKIKDIRRFQAIILDNVSTKNSFQGKILGRELKYWVKFALGDISTRILEYTASEPILEQVRNYISNEYDYTFVLLSSTALLEEADICVLKDYAIYKNICLCKLPVGYILNNRYFLSTDKPNVDSVYTGNIDNFYIIENKKQYKYALEILQDRINNFHIENGVEIVKPNLVYIEPEVDISSGVTIYPGVAIRGNSSIGEDTIIKDNAVIENSDIGDKCFIGGAHIENCLVGSGVCVASFCEIGDSTIGNGAMIDSNCVIKGTKIKKDTKVKSGTVLGEKDDSSSGTR